MILEKKAKIIRREVLNLAMRYKVSHIAPAYSIVEILLALYEKVLKDDDKFILSKGHGCLSLYTILRQQGLNPTISGHPDIERNQGIECTTGSLGHGLPLGTGMALARKLKNKEGNIYVLISDGECQEGTTWESILIAAHHELDNLTIIVDHNKMQSLGRVDEILSLGNLREKFESFGCYVVETDGHRIPEVISALKIRTWKKPKVIIAHTIKGKGVSFMENKPEWHNRIPNPEELKVANKDLK